MLVDIRQIIQALNIEGMVYDMGILIALSPKCGKQRHPDCDVGNSWCRHYKSVLSAYRDNGYDCGTLRMTLL